MYDKITSFPTSVGNLSIVLTRVCKLQLIYYQTKKLLKDDFNGRLRRATYLVLFGFGARNTVESHNFNMTSNLLKYDYN